MKPFRFFDAAEYARLDHLSKSSDTHPRLTPAQRQGLAALLKEGTTITDARELARCVALGDRVKLTSPHDADDWYELELVLPADADVDADRIPLFTPVGIALLGRRTGEMIAWETPVGTREMSITSVVKLVAAGA
ncbi:GreA/GreB family elongation factor [Luteolibacter flavescens]|uniref:GreA/GreB family elongation factor n=1 Tax=Luteolibacter flavescens TaxID=1859460 RepID=A0ABT3FP84_9BACT|nr:GreA/GreB family elongation factor [Luteolibacter flavescens]MCW1884800.1 GreA/GreB family elongation factor [Luteolibacter flavescens]